MRTKAIVGVLATLLLGIVGSPALLASSAGPNWDRHRGGGHYDQYRMKELARELERTSERVLYELKHDRYRRSRAAIEAVYALHECAEDYSRLVRRHSDYRRGYEMYRGLVGLYRDAEYAVSHARNRSAEHELYRVGRVLGALDVEYSKARGVYRGGYSRNDRYDEGRYGRYETGRRYDDWRYRGRSRGGATIELPRIRLRLPF